MLIENDAGAAGTLAARRVARAAPDGHTLIMGNMGTHAVAVSQYRNLGYQPLADFTPIGLTASVPAVVVARRDFPGTTLVDLRSALRAKPEGLSEAHIGVGSPTHTFCTLLHGMMGTRAVRVAYRGGSQAMSDLVGGHADFSCISLSGAISQINAGSLKPSPSRRASASASSRPFRLRRRAPAGLRGLHLERALRPARPAAGHPLPAVRRH